MPWSSIRIFFLCNQHDFFPNVSASALGFESRQQSTALVVERREPGLRVWDVTDVHGGGPSALLAGFLQWKGSPLHFVGWDAYHRLSPSLFLGREDGVETVETRPGEHWLLGGQRRAVVVHVRARSTTLYLLPVTGERRNLAISSSLKSHALLWSKDKKKFKVIPSLNDSYVYTNTATREEAIALVKVRCKLRWWSPEQTRVSCFFGFANVTNTFHACKRNAVHTSASKEQTLINKFWTVSLQARKKKREARSLKLPGKLQRFSEAWSLGRWTDRPAQPFSRPGRADGRLCSEMNRATGMGNFLSKINAQIAVTVDQRCMREEEHGVGTISYKLSLRGGFWPVEWKSCMGKH